QSQAPQPFNTYTPVNTAQDPAFGSDGTTFLIAENDPSPATTVRVRDVGFTPGSSSNPVPVTATTVLGANTATNNPLSYVGRGAFDLPAGTKIASAAQSATGSTFVTPASAGAARDATLQWPN